MDLGSSDHNTNWLLGYHIIEDIAVPGGEFAGADTGFGWPPPPRNASPNASVEVECSFGDSDSLKEVGSKKRVEVDCVSGDSDNVKEVASRKRVSQHGQSNLLMCIEISDTRNTTIFDGSKNDPDFNLTEQIEDEVEDIETDSTMNAPLAYSNWPNRQKSESCSKACREKLRRDRLNERFLELVAVMEPGRLPRTDKAAILSDAVRILVQLRNESRQFKETISDLQTKVTELKAEKVELRDERRRIKEEKDRLEQQVRMMFAGQQSSFMSNTLALGSRALSSSNKIMPFISYPSMTMWQPAIPQATPDTSQDHALRPPVA